MLEAIRKTNPNTDYMYVVDTRPRVSKIILKKKKQNKIKINVRPKQNKKTIKYSKHAIQLTSHTKLEYKRNFVASH